MINKSITTAITLLLLVSVVSAAVYTTFNPEARLHFDRDQPGPDVLPVQTLFDGDTFWGSAIELGTMDGNRLEAGLRHENTGTEPFSGIVYFEIECDEGMTNFSGGGIMDFEKIRYVDPHGITYFCNQEACIERLDASNSIKITPPGAEFTFESDTFVYTDFTIVFMDYAYGNYTLTAYVDEVEP